MSNRKIVASSYECYRGIEGAYYRLEPGTTPGAELRQHCPNPCCVPTLECMCGFLTSLTCLTWAQAGAEIDAHFAKGQDK